MTRLLSRAVRIALMILSGLALGPARTVEAAAFRVTPIRIDFEKGSQSALLTLINESNDQIRFQISAFAWAQKPDGEMKLEPTSDIVFFPGLLMLKAGEQRKVRVGSVTAQGAMEKTYRVFFEELPSLETKEMPAGGSAVRILTKMGIPVFIAPAKPVGGGEITNATVKDGKVRFDLRNTGNISFVTQRVGVVGLDGLGGEVFRKQREGWYVLSGDTRGYDLDLTTDECQKVKKIQIEAHTNLAVKSGQAVLKGEIPVGSSACSSK